MNVIIVGGGASGLVAAIRLGKENNVTIIEKANDIGKKILVTGNGHCNYFNKDMSVDHYLTSNEGINDLIDEKYVEQVIPFFESIGVKPYLKDNYYYPLSYEARTVRYFLLRKIKENNVNVVLSEEVVNIEINDEDKYEVTTDRNKYKADKVIVSTGGSSFELLTKLDHTVIHITKALCGIKGNKEDAKYWGGIRIKANLKLFLNDNLIKEENGDLQLTDYGISGICSMNLSNYVGRFLLKKNNHYILINFIPSINSYEEFSKFIEEGKTKFDDIKSIMYQVLNDKLVDILLNGINKNDIKELYNRFIKYKFIPKDLNDLNGQVTSGGIPLDQVRLSTMESLLHEGLYITGELLNVVGDCGGYNLGLAWITGLKAGDAINDKNKKH